MAPVFIFLQKIIGLKAVDFNDSVAVVSTLVK